MNYAELAFTEGIKKLQEQYGSRNSYAKMERYTSTDGLTPRERSLIEARDSFYAASYGENGYPYVQHRGGPPGFLRVLDERTLGFLDFSGNRQYITLGNVAHNDKVALILVDYPRQARLKIYARAEVVALGAYPQLEARLDLGDYGARPERVILYHVQAYDWNCPQHITPRYSAAEIEEAFAGQRAYIAELEQEVKRLRQNGNLD